MITQTQSTTPLDPVVVEPSLDGGAHVWLRREIQEKIVDEQPFWFAREIHFTVPEQITVKEITEQFDDLWEKHPVTPVTVQELAVENANILKGLVGELQPKRAPDAKWEQPQGVIGMYMKGQTCTIDGVLWKSKINYNVTKPGSDIQWWERVEEPETEPTPVPWTEQQWPKGSLVTHDGRVWLALQDVLAPNWAPGPALYAYWKDMGAV